MLVLESLLITITLNYSCKKGIVRVKYHLFLANFYQIRSDIQKREGIGRKGEIRGDPSKLGFSLLNRDGCRVWSVIMIKFNMNLNTPPHSPTTGMQGLKTCHRLNSSSRSSKPLHINNKINPTTVNAELISSALSWNSFSHTV